MLVNRKILFAALDGDRETIFNMNLIQLCAKT